MKYTFFIFLFLITTIVLLMSSCNSIHDDTAIFKLQSDKQTDVPYTVNELNEAAPYLTDSWYKRDGTEAFAVGENGTILHYKNNSWIQEAKGLTNERLNRLWIDSSFTNGWAIEDGGVILHFENGFWTQQSQGVTSSSLTQLSISEKTDNGWIIGDKGVILHLKNNEWFHEEIDEVPDGLNNIWMSSDYTSGWIIGKNGMILKYAKGIWRREIKRVTYESLDIIWMKNDGTEGWIIGRGKELLHYFNGDWKIDSIKIPEDIDDIKFIWMDTAAIEGWAGGINGTFLHFRNKEWQFVKLNTHPYKWLESIWMDSTSTNGWIVVRDGPLLHFENGQWNWQREKLQFSSISGRLNINSEGTEGGFVSENKILHFKNGKWTEEGREVIDDFTKIKMSIDNTEGWAIGRLGLICHFKNGRWYREAKGLTEEYLSNLWINKTSTEVWVIGSSGTILHFSKGQWSKEVNNLTDANLWHLHFSPDGEAGWVIGDDGTILHLTDGHWKLENNEFGSSNLLNLFTNNDATQCWITGSKGLILHNQNGEWKQEAKGITNTSLIGIWMNNEGSQGFAISKEGAFLYYANKQWRDKGSEISSKELNQLWMNSGGTEGWAVGEQGTFMHYINAQWKQEAINLTDENILYLTMNANATEGWALGDNTIFHYKDNRWFVMAREDITDLSLNSDTLGFGVGKNGLIVNFKRSENLNVIISNDEISRISNLSGKCKITFNKKVKLIEGLYLDGLEELNFSKGQQYSCILDSSGLFATVEFMHNDNITKKYSHSNFHLGFKIAYAASLTSEVFFMKMEKAFQIDGPSSVFYLVWIIVALFVLNFTLVLLAIYIHPIRWLILHSIGSQFVGLIIGKYFVTDLLIHFISPIRLAIFKQYRAELRNAPFLYAWNKERKYIPPSISIEGFEAPNKTKEDFEDTLEYILKKPTNIVWTIVGRSGLGKTALLEIWTEISLRKNVTPILIRLGSEASAISICVTSVSRYGDLYLKQSDLLDILRWGGFLLLLDGFNEDVHPDETIRFIQTIAKRNIIILAGQDKPLGLRDLNTRDIYLAPFGKHELAQLIGEGWAEKVFATNYLSEIVKMPQTAKLLAEYINKNRKLPSYGLDVYADLIRMEQYDVSIVNLLRLKSWDLFSKQEIVFAPDNTLPNNFCELAIKAGILTKSMNQYRFSHERIHRYYVSCFIYTSEDLNIDKWHSRLMRGQTKLYWDDVVEFIGDLIVQEINVASINQRKNYEQMYQTFILSIFTFSPTLYKNRIYPQYINFYNSGLISQDTSFLLVASQTLISNGSAST